MRDPDTQALIDSIRAAFPAKPVPPWPARVGIDPLGKQELAAFVGSQWTGLDEDYEDRHYDVGPAVAFVHEEPPHLWNYHVPGFLMYALQHPDSEWPNGFDFCFGRLPVATPERHQPLEDWWRSDLHHGNYNSEQCRCIARFLRHEADRAGSTGTSELTNAWCLAGGLLG